jgi:hypothetical protein
MVKRIIVLFILFISFCGIINSQDSINKMNIWQAFLDFSDERNSNNIAFGLGYNSNSSGKHEELLLGIGYERIRYCRYCHNSNYTQIKRSIILEKYLFNSDLYKLNFGVFYEDFIIVGLNLFTISNLKNYNLNITPNIGFRYYSVSLIYGYNFNIIYSDLLGIHNKMVHSINLRYNLNVDKKYLNSKKNEQ